MPLFIDAFERLYDAGFSVAIRESLYLFPALNILHVVAIVLLAGTIAVVDLRLLGAVLRDVPISRLSRQILPLTWLGAAAMFITGFLLFAPQASKIYANPALQLKLALLVAAGINVAVWHATLARHVVHWDVLARPPWQARLAGTLSLLLWAGIIVAGRMIAFVA